MAAINNDPEVVTKARALCEQRATVYEDSETPEEFLAEYDFTKPLSRLAFSVSCLPEALRNKVLHNVYKGMCVWVGTSGTWIEDSPGEILLAGKDRLRCDDTSGAVLSEVAKVLEETVPEELLEATMEKYVVALTTYMKEVYVEAQAHLNSLRRGLDLVEPPEPEEPTQGTRGALEPGAKLNLADNFKHPTLALSSELVTMVAWVIDAEPSADLDDLEDDYDLRSRIYGLPRNNACLLVQVASGDHEGLQLIVHEDELAT
jgi:hypothetical protein